MKVRGFARALRALAALACVALILATNVPFEMQTVYAQDPTKIEDIDKFPDNGKSFVINGHDKVANVGNVFAGDDDVEHISKKIKASSEILVKIEVTFKDANSDMDLFLFKLPEGAQVGDLSDIDIVDSSALSGNPETTGPSRFLVAAPAKVEGVYAFAPGDYVIGLSIFDDPSVTETDWTMTITSGGTTEELIGDSGLPNSGVNITGTTVIQVNCVTPTVYPFKVTGARFNNFRFSGQPSPVGRTVDVVSFVGPAPAAGMPPAPPAKPTMTTTTVTIAKTGQWVDYAIPNGPTAQQGEVVYIGYKYTPSGSGIFPTIDVGRDKKDRSFISVNNGDTWRLLALSSGNPADLTTRALGTPGPAPARAGEVKGLRGIEVLK